MKRAPYIHHISVRAPQFAPGDVEISVCRSDTVADDNLRPCRQSAVVHHRPDAAVQNALDCANAPRYAGSPRHARPALPRQHIVGESPAVQYVQRAFDKPVVQNYRHSRRDGRLVLDIYAYTAQVVSIGRSVENPHLELFVAAHHRRTVCRLTRLAGGRWTLFERSHDRRLVVARHAHHVRHLPGAQVLALPGSASVVNRLAACAIWPEVPAVDTFRSRLDFYHFDKSLGARHRVCSDDARCTLDRVRAFEHARSDARRVLDDRPALAVPVALNEAIINLGLHRLGGELGLLDGLLDALLTAHLLNLSGRQARNRCWLERPCPIVGRQEHVGNAG